MGKIVYDDKFIYEERDVVITTLLPLDGTLFQKAASAGSISRPDVMAERNALIVELDDLRKRLVAAETVNQTFRSWLAQAKLDYAQGYADGLAKAPTINALASPPVSPQNAAVGRAITRKWLT